MKNVYSVGQINSYIKNMFAQDFMLRSVYVKGEVSNVKYHSSNHIYFTMKDKVGTLNCVMFATYRKGLKFTLKDGMQVIAFGSIEVYERDGKYQLYARDIVPDGEGALYERFEQLKKELEEMGMFAQEYKKPIPMYPKTIGVVTAPTGAAIRDIINISTRRNPHVKIILYPAKVQGEGAAESVAAGIRALEAMNVDVMIVGRGGGSIEDLWAFNEEVTARAIFDCSIPIVSAVGHETDVTIADFVADLRAPTPSAAAELTVFEYEAVVARMEEIKEDLKEALVSAVKLKRDALTMRKLRLSTLSPGHRLNEYRMRLANTHDRLNESMQRLLKNKRHLLDIKIERLEALSPMKRLGSGYAFVENKSGRPVTGISDINKGDEVSLYLKDGMARAEIKGISKEGV